MATVPSTNQYKTVEPTIQETRPQGPMLSREKLRRSSKPLVLMGLSYLGAIAVAIAHHLVYAKYNHRPVDGVNLSQNWIIRIGTALAFIAKTLFVLAASIAYTQQQWLVTKSSALELRQIDIVSSILQNFFGFFQTRLWLKHPLLALLSVTAWLLPIAAVLTPATITVELHSESISKSSTPSQLYYDPIYYANLDNNGAGGARDYRGPSSETQRVVYATATSGQVLNLPIGKDNMSYALEFLGPALHCVPITNQSLVVSVRDLWTGTLGDYGGFNGSYMDGWVFAAWLPDPSDPGNFTIGLHDPMSSSIFVDTWSRDAAHLYVMPNSTVISSSSSSGSNNTAHHNWDDLLDCALYNASYTASFNFTPPSQNATVMTRTLLNGVSATGVYDYDVEELHAWYEGFYAQQLCFQSVMDAFGRLLIGAEIHADENIWTMNTNWAITAIDWTMRDSASQGLEELFSNITLSMMSSGKLRMNDTLISRHPIDTTFFEKYNIYIYHANILWLSYGIAAGVTLLCMALGLSAMIRNGACYENVFSTFFRVTANMAEMRQLVQPNDDGRAPLPTQIGKARVVAWNTGNDSKGISTNDGVAMTQLARDEDVPLMRDRNSIYRKPVPLRTQAKTDTM